MRGSVQYGLRITDLMTTEEIVLSHSHRGMDILSRYLPHHFVGQAARRISELPCGNILIATGFYVAGHAETDGPAGAFAFADALSRIGFSPVIITDRYCTDYFEDTGMKIVICDSDLQPGMLLSSFDPVALVSIERCGVNADGIYANMNGTDISPFTPPIDKIFSDARDCGIYTAGIGDGGNEIGMGNLRNIISDKLKIKPCIIETDDLIVSDVSNWGAYALCAELGKLSGQKLLPSADVILSFIEHTVSRGAVDGVTRKNSATEDGYPAEISAQIIEQLCMAQ